jgi:chromosome segregation ATPase
MQGYDRPDVRALEDLSELLRHVGEELAAWRRRSLKAESDMAELKAKGGVLAGPELIQARQRIIELELENQALRQRIDATRGRVKLLADRMSFLEQDADDGAP